MIHAFRMFAVNTILGTIGLISGGASRYSPAVKSCNCSKNEESMKFGTRILWSMWNHIRSVATFSSIKNRLICIISKWQIFGVNL